MLKTLTIKRKKKMAGSVIKFYVVMNMKGSDFNAQVGKQGFALNPKASFLLDSDQVFTIKNGEEITIDLTEEVNSFFVTAFTSAGKVYSERIRIDDWKQHSVYTVQMKMGTLANSFEIEEV